MDRAPAVFRLMDQLRYRWCEWASASSHARQRLPTLIEFSVNDVCDSRCQICQIWKQKADHEITPEELATILTNPLFREVRGVVFNGGEPTLRNDLAQLAQVVISTLPGLRDLSLNTNAIDEDRVLNSIEAIGLRCRSAGIPFFTMVSIDGIGEVHDRIRGVPGNFASADRVISRLSTSPLVKACVIGCTLMRENIYEAERVLLYARSKSVHARFRLGIPLRRLYNLDLSGPFDLDESQRHHLACFLDELRLNYETAPVRRAFYLSLRDQVVYGAQRSAGCSWRNRGVTLTARGELAYCAVASPTLGSALQERPEDLYWKNAPVLRDILANRCPHCRHDNDGLISRGLLLERMMRNSLGRFPKGAVMLGFGQRMTSAWRDRSADRHARHPNAFSGSVKKTAAPNAILLCGPYGAETLGERAALAGLMLSLRSAGWQGPVDLASQEPFVSDETRRDLPEAGLRRVERVERARMRISQGEYCLVAAAGGTLTSSASEVFDLLGLFTEANASGTPRAFLGIGVTPGGFSRRRQSAVRRLLAMSQLTVFRDPSSLDLARPYVDLKSTSVLPDPAFIWAARQMAKPSSRSRQGPVLLALRELQAGECDSPRSVKTAAERKAYVEQELIELVKALLRVAPGWGVRLLAGNTYAREGDDRLFFHRLLSAYPEILSEIQWKRATPAEDFAAFRAARAVVAMRAHNEVLAVAAGVPHLILGTSPAYGENAIPLEEFSGEACAARLMEIVTRAPADPPSGVEESYAVAWRQALAVLENSRAA